MDANVIMCYDYYVELLIEFQVLKGQENEDIIQWFMENTYRQKHVEERPD